MVPMTRRVHTDHVQDLGHVLATGDGGQQGGVEHVPAEENQGGVPGSLQGTHFASEAGRACEWRSWALLWDTAPSRCRTPRAPTPTPNPTQPKTHTHKVTRTNVNTNTHSLAHSQSHTAPRLK